MKKINTHKSLRVVILLILLISLTNCHNKTNDPKPSGGPNPGSDPKTVNQKPVANFNFIVVNNGILPCTVNFTDTSKYADTYKWDFDDGNSSTNQNPRNTYTLAKTYNVKLIVSNALSKDSVTKQVTISLDKPKADFNFTLTNEGSLPGKVLFVNTSLRGHTYKWNFGDGNSSASESPEHAFNVSGTFPVKLVVSNQSGKDSVSKDVVISKVISIHIPHSVRIFLITPTDRAYNQKYYDAIKMCALNLQKWYKEQMGGKTFTLNNPMIEILQGKHTYAWYNQYNDTYSGTNSRFYGYYNTLYEIQQVIGALNTELYMNAIYVAAPGGGAGSPGLCALGDQDLDGLLGVNPTNLVIDRWIGGSGHEWGHAFGLSHPVNQDPTALMWTGLYNYPNCVLLQEDKDILNVSPFFK